MDNPGKSIAFSLPRDPFLRILLENNQRYSKWQVEDLYKLIHQAAMGSEHAVKDVAAVQKWMETELATMGEGPADPVDDPIRPDSQILRIHLRPYVALGGNIQSLLDAFIATANEFKGSLEDLMIYWASARQLANEGSLPFFPAELDNFFNEVRKAGFPAGDHSVIYEDLYRPAYRVISVDMLSMLNLPK